MALGGVIGGILGAAAGTVLLPGLGTTAGASLGAGLGQSIQGAVQKKKAKAMLPPPEDVGERALLNTLRRQKQAIATGTASMDKTNALKGALKTFTKNSFSTGGVNQGAYNAMLNQGIANITEGTAQQTAQNLSEQRQLATQMANLKNDRTFLQRNEQMADAAENQKAGFQNLSSALQPSGDYKYNEEGLTADEAAKERIKKLLKKPTKETEVDANGNPITE